MIVYRNFVSLCHLLVPKDIVQTTILAEERTRLLEVERHRLRQDIGVLLKLRIAPKHIAVLAALALLVASVP